MQFSLYANLHSQTYDILTVMTSDSARVIDFSPHVFFAVKWHRTRDLTVAMIDKTSNGFNLCRHKRCRSSTTTLILYSRGSQPGVHVLICRLHLLYIWNKSNLRQKRSILVQFLDSCAGWNFLSAPAPHTSNPHPPRRPSQPAPHFFGLKPAAVRKLLKTHN